MKKITLLFLLLLATQMHSQCWKQLSGSLYSSVAITDDGTMWSWGSNIKGVLGIGMSYEDFGNSAVPIQIGSDNDWLMVSSGKGLGHHAAAIKTDGSLWVWGDNDQGQLGDGTYEDKTSPSQIGVGSTWEAISGGQDFMFALKSDGTIWSWGTHGNAGTPN